MAQQLSHRPLSDRLEGKSEKRREKRHPGTATHIKRKRENQN